MFYIKRRRLSHHSPECGRQQGGLPFRAGGKDAMQPPPFCLTAEKQEGSSLSFRVAVCSLRMAGGEYEKMFIFTGAALA